MADIGFEIKNQIYETSTLVIEFLKKINPIAAIVVLIALYVLFFRRWEFTKIFSLFATWFLLLIVYVRLNSFFANALAPDAAEISLAILRIVTGFIVAAIFLYHAMVAQ
jgi:hypothetical protein